MENYTIGQIAAMFELPGSTLRYYEQLGLLPEVSRNQSGQRVYQQEHIDRLHAICCFKRTGMSMAKLQEFFQYEQDQRENIDEILSLLRTQEEEMEEKIRQYQEDLLHVKCKLNFYCDKKKAFENQEKQPFWNNYMEKN